MEKKGEEKIHAKSDIVDDDEKDDYNNNINDGNENGVMGQCLDYGPDKNGHVQSHSSFIHSTNV